MAVLQRLCGEDYEGNRRSIRPAPCIPVHKTGEECGPSTSQSSSAQPALPPIFDELALIERGLLNKRRAAVRAGHLSKLQSQEEADEASRRRRVGRKSKRAEDEDYTSSFDPRPTKTHKLDTTGEMHDLVDTVQYDPEKYCDLCDLPFGRPSDLVRHSETSIKHLTLLGRSGNLKSASFRCQGCSAVFTRKDALKRHQQSSCG